MNTIAHFLRAAGIGLYQPAMPSALHQTGAFLSPARVTQLRRLLGITALKDRALASRVVANIDELDDDSQWHTWQQQVSDKKTIAAILTLKKGYLSQGALRDCTPDELVALYDRLTDLQAFFADCQQDVDMLPSVHRAPVKNGTGLSANETYRLYLGEQMNAVAQCQQTCMNALTYRLQLNAIAPNFGAGDRRVAVLAAVKTYCPRVALPPVQPPGALSVKTLQAVIRCLHDAGGRGQYQAINRYYRQLDVPQRVNEITGAWVLPGFETMVPRYPRLMGWFAHLPMCRFITKGMDAHLKVACHALHAATLASDHPAIDAAMVQTHLQALVSAKQQLALAQLDYPAKASVSKGWFARLTERLASWMLGAELGALQLQLHETLRDMTTQVTTLQQTLTQRLVDKSFNVKTLTTPAQLVVAKSRVNALLDTLETDLTFDGSGVQARLDAASCAMDLKYATLRLTRAPQQKPQGLVQKKQPPAVRKTPQKITVMNTSATRIEKQLGSPLQANQAVKAPIKPTPVIALPVVSAREPIAEPIDWQQATLDMLSLQHVRDFIEDTPLSLPAIKACASHYLTLSVAYPDVLKNSAVQDELHRADSLARERLRDFFEHPTHAGLDTFEQSVAWLSHRLKKADWAHACRAHLPMAARVLATLVTYGWDSAAPGIAALKHIAPNTLVQALTGLEKDIMALPVAERNDTNLPVYTSARKLLAQCEALRYMTLGTCQSTLAANIDTVDTALTSFVRAQYPLRAQAMWHAAMKVMPHVTTWDALIKTPAVAAMTDNAQRALLRCVFACHALPKKLRTASSQVAVATIYQVLHQQLETARAALPDENQGVIFAVHAQLATPPEAVPACPYSPVRAAASVSTSYP